MPTQKLISMARAFVQEYMSAFDGSHDFSHIERVLSNAIAIFNELRNPVTPDPDPAIAGFGPPNAAAASPDSSFTAAITATPLDLNVIILCALLHDVGDHKYLKPGEDAAVMVRDILLSFGCDDELATKVQIICGAVSYSGELADGERVADLVAMYPELAVVQDADRLDAIGAIGIGRVFAYGGAKAECGMEESIAIFKSKLLRINCFMKTEPGKRMAFERTERLKTFLGWWEDEMA